MVAGRIASAVRDRIRLTGQLVRPAALNNAFTPLGPPRYAAGRQQNPGHRVDSVTSPVVGVRPQVAVGVERFDVEGLTPQSDGEEDAVTESGGCTKVAAAP